MKLNHENKKLNSKMKPVLKDLLRAEVENLQVTFRYTVPETFETKI